MISDFEQLVSDFVSQSKKREKGGECLWVCPANHRLKSTTAENDVNCFNCDKDLKKGTNVWHCCECNPSIRRFFVFLCCECETKISKPDYNYKFAKIQWDLLYDHLCSGRGQAASELFCYGANNLIKHNLINNTVGSHNGQTLLHWAASRNQLPMCKQLLSKSNDALALLNIKTTNNRTPYSLATANIKEYFTLFKRQSADAIEKIAEKSFEIYKQNLIVDSFYKQAAQNGGLLDSLLDIVTAQLRGFEPISDDNLLLCFKYCRDDKYSLQSKDKKDAFINQFKFTVDNLLNADKNNKLKHFNLFYFRQFLIDSNYWYLNIRDEEKLFDESKDDSKDESLGLGREDKITFDGLQRLVHSKLSVQRDFIKKSIKNLSETEGKDWQALVTYSEGKNNFIDKSQLMPEPRQDMIKNGTLAQFDVAFFDEIGLLANQSDTINYNFPHLYSINCYLQLLLIKAHSLNSSFQEEMRLLYDKHRDLNVSYSSAPVKLRQRCVIKCESDYSNKKFPNAAHLCDLIRCSFSFKTVSSLLKGLEIFEKKHGKQVVRLKNGFKDFDGDIDKIPLQYRDIKYNIIVSDAQGKNCIIGEIQFMLSFMLKAKAIGHSLYSIVRKADYVESVHYIHKLRFGVHMGQSQILRNCVTKRDYRVYGLTMLRDVKEAVEYLDLVRHLCIEYWLKGFKLFHSFVLKHLIDNKNIVFDSSNNKKFDSNLLTKDEVDERFSVIMNIQTGGNRHLLSWHQAQIGKVRLPARQEILKLFEYILDNFAHVIDPDEWSWTEMMARLYHDCFPEFMKAMLERCIRDNCKDGKLYDLDMNSILSQGCKEIARKKKVFDECVEIVLSPRYAHYTGKRVVIDKEYEGKTVKQWFDETQNQKYIQMWIDYQKLIADSEL